jgi:sporulation protein YlmC with PRC-barrel domain
MMMRSASHLKGTTIAATDGDIGSVQDLYFDDLTWTIRYLMVDTGTWLPGRQVLISPRSVGTVTDEHRIPVALTRSQVENSPSTDTDKPVDRQYEEEYSRYYGYPYYWTGPYRWGETAYPGEALALPVAPEMVYTPPTGDPSLRSVRNVTGYYIEATDGDLGHVEDFIVDTGEWALRYMVVDTRNWWPG